MDRDRRRVRQAACSSLGEPPYGVFGALFREAYEVRPNNSLDVARQKLAEGRRSIGSEPQVIDTIAPVLGSVLGIDERRPRELDPEQLKPSIAHCRTIRSWPR